MSKLEDFLGLNDVSDVREVVKLSLDGKELEIVVRALTQSEHSEFQKRAIKFNGKSTSLDLGKYNDMLLDACIVEPNFHDARFLDKAKCVSASDFLNKKFPAGVLTDIASKIQALSGFDSFKAEIEDAKN